jgi:protein required for attachment to host cells
MSVLTLPAGCIVLVGDGRKVLFLRNRGSATKPDLKAEQVLEQENPATRDQGTDRPGTQHQSTNPTRSSYEPTDWHRIEEERFAEEAVAGLANLLRQGRLDQAVIVAPPKTLAAIRTALPKDIAARIAAEINKDLTKHPVQEIQRRILAA